MSLFKELEQKAILLRDKIKELEPDPICDCYAKNSDNCWLWDSCSQKIINPSYQHSMEYINGYE